MGPPCKPKSPYPYLVIYPQSMPRKNWRKDDRENPLDVIISYFIKMTGKAHLMVYPKKKKQKKKYIYIYKVAPNFPTCWPGTLLSLKSQVRGTQIPSKQLRSIFPYIKIDWGGITSWQLVQFLNKKSSNFRPLWHYFHDQFLKHRDKYSLVLIYTMVFFLI